MTRSRSIAETRQKHNDGLTTLAGAGVDFTLPEGGNTGVYTTGWPLYRPDLATVARHVDKGGNLGVHIRGYADGWVLVAFDGDDAAGMAALLAIAPELSDSLRSWRASGSGKALAWVHDPDGKLKNQSTPNLAGEHSKRELLTILQATIYGVHPSGQRYETNWLTPITLTVDQVRAIWETWAGQTWTEAKPARVKVEPGKGYTRDDGGDVERVKACLLYTSPSPRDRTRSRMPSSA